MADNVPLPAAAGNAAADEIGSGIFHQRVKVSVGADGVAKDFQPATVVASASGSGDVALVGSACTLLGWSFAESAGSPNTAKAYLRDGTDATGTIVATITLNPSESIRETGPASGIKCATGLYLDRVSGSCEVSAWYVP